MTTQRSSSEIEKQIAAFKATLPEDVDGPPQDDFAAKLEWEAWQTHLRELESELAEVLLHEAVPTAKDVSHLPASALIKLGCRLSRC